MKNAFRWQQITSLPGISLPPMPVLSLSSACWFFTSQAFIPISWLTGALFLKSVFHFFFKRSSPLGNRGARKYHLSIPIWPDSSLSLPLTTNPPANPVGYTFQIHLEFSLSSLYSNHPLASHHHFLPRLFTINSLQVPASALAAPQLYTQFMPHIRLTFSCFILK